MRRILYPGGSLDTGDDIAAAVLEYARQLARSETADTVLVPGRGVEGGTGSVEFLLGPASQLVSEPLAFSGPEIEDAEFVRTLHRRASRLAGGPGRPDPFTGSDLPDTPA
ncbi:hypothetical protein IT072_13975 [Leifsonia sp. ZF2019]|uniref:hypothetical protein n=1 Tax=Leifsonia sp. ZF2019 TaxID=2781978 RepID=UPI001CBBE25A|nr:hypothetical protein [Leifsonia sp. ZF2019]UAJ78366.1 hypothetical protein IT072_13975 [Leifsonia sp. ZF2019]